ncbi:DUF3404 domain-containing protein [Aliivibrio kagoshimensis]|uniref:ATP-binding protein n=1 Tax=Aliivibrio kagoshimensis TaxID=2910230 RepID=UPI003D0FE136
MRWCISALFFILFIPVTVCAQNLQSKWQLFYQQSWHTSPLTVLNQELSQYPSELLLDGSRYPNFTKFRWQDIALLSSVRQGCQYYDHDNQDLSDSITFELALCSGKTLDERWFSTHSLLHPAGGSFADRYFESFSSEYDDIKSYLSIANPQHPLYQTLSNLSPEGREALLNGYRAWQEGNTLWLSGEQGWKAITSSHWLPIADQLNITFQAESCTFRYSNLCISEQTESQLMLRILVIAFLIILLMVLARGGYLKRKLGKEKYFILQLLTHELRTPITSIGLTIEMFRDEYDNLSKDAQDAVWRLISDYQRLSQLTENSKIYLSADKSQQLLTQRASLDEWLNYVCGKHRVIYTLDQDIELNQPYYWLSICLDNLIKNAKQHGKGVVIVTTKLTDKLTIEVKDEGRFPSPLLLFLSRLQPKSNDNNMGIGLSIVKHIMKKADGKFIILRHPTRCILELPYDEHRSVD